MKLQARLTLWSVLVMTAIVALISAVDLGNDMQRQFEATLERAELLQRVSTNLVVRTLGRDQKAPLREALRNPTFQDDLTEFMTSSSAVLEIAVCSLQNEILADSDPTRLGRTFPPYPDFRPIVKSTGWVQKIRVLYADDNYYQLEQPLGSGNRIELYVRVVVYPALIRKEITPTMQKSAEIAVASAVGAVVIILLFSTLAFRPLGQLGQMLDKVTRGEYQAQEPMPPPGSKDEFGVMASKVSLLGEQLRGAQFDFTDLRGNFERLLDDLEDAVLIFGRERRLVIASGAVEKFMGKMRSDLMGQSLAEVFPPNTPLGLLIAQAAQTVRPIHNRRVPINLPDSGGNVVVALLSIDLMESGSGSGLLVRLRDPEATRQIGRQLQTADQLSAISKIIGGVAHEVKNPLNAMLMHVELARMKLARGDTELESHMEIISREIGRLDRVVKTFLDFTRPVELNVSQIPVEEFLSEIVDLARPQAQAAGIQVRLDQQADGACIHVDKDLLKQAILNVAMNAIEAMPDGGELQFKSDVQGDEAEISIVDTGTGIPPELREKIFRLYFTTKKEGSGIGLAMTFRIVQLHDGTIDFTSEPGKGTTFVLRFPTVV